jgi:hypothetical protein
MNAAYRNLLAACIRKDARLCHSLLSELAVNWETLFETANWEYVLPMVAMSAQVGLLGSPPTEVLEFLTAIRSLNGERNQKILEEVWAVAKVLNSLGIQPVLLKGAAYLETGLYANIADRFTGDVDLLVAENQSGEAVALLKDHGFAEDKQDRLGRFRHHHPALIGPNGICIEIHHALGDAACSRLLPASEVIEASTFVERDGVAVRIPSPCHLIVHLIMHSQIHNAYDERIWPPLRAIQDLRLLQTRVTPSVWSEIEHRFRTNGFGDILALHLLDAFAIVEASIPISAKMNWVLRLQRCRRSLLRREPKLRFIDPVYMMSLAGAHRLRNLRGILAEPDGRRLLLAHLADFSVYRRLWTDLLRGRRAE